MAQKNAQEFILLPPPASPGEQKTLTPDIASFFTMLHIALGADPVFHFKNLFQRFLGATVAALDPQLPTEGAKAELRIIDSIFEGNAKLVELVPASISMLRAILPGVRIAPVTYGYPAVPPAPILEGDHRGPRGSASPISLKVVSSADGSPVVGARVTAFTECKRVNGVVSGEGAGGKTDARGVVRLNLRASRKKLARLYVHPATGFWDFMKDGITVRSGMKIQLAPLDLKANALHHFYPNSALDAGQNVKVGVVDTGVSAHPNLVIDGGRNVQVSEDANDYGDNGINHGTHVAGIIAARGTPPDGTRGVAPGVTLRSYRVFPKGQLRTLNFYIAGGIELAANEGCDLINVSLSIDEQTDPTIEHSIAYARTKGAVVIAAAGNNDRGAVRYPASDSLAIGVSAFGRKETFHAASSHAGEVAAPYGKSRKNFVARFSSIGADVDLIAPGVGIISTVAGGYAAQFGTSMACPAVTGCAAKLLSSVPHTSILAMSRDANRADAITKLILNSAAPLGFGRTYEGQGMM
jgi:subtilisin